MYKELEPCGHCGTHAFWLTTLSRIKCCNARCGIMGPICETRCEALERWNTRTPAATAEREDETKALVQTPRINEAIQTALERGEVTISDEGFLTALRADHGELRDASQKLLNLLSDFSLVDGCSIDTSEQVDAAMADLERALTQGSKT